MYYKNRGYVTFDTEIGKVYIPENKIEISDDISIRYEKHPWIERFEVDGARPKPVKRKGYGKKDIRGFVKSLSTIYAMAYVEFESCSKPETYFKHVAETFIYRYLSDSEVKMFKKFCGFTENMWREGNKESCDIALNQIIPLLKECNKTWDEFLNVITKEFKEFLVVFL